MPAPAREDRPVRPRAAREPPRQEVPLRHGARARRLRHGAAGRQRGRTTGEGGGQSGAPHQPGSLVHLGPGHAPRPLRPGQGPGLLARRQPTVLEGSPLRDPEAGPGARGRWRRASRLPARAGCLAHPGQPPPQAPGSLSQGTRPRLGAGHRGERRRGSPHRLRAAARRPPEPRAGAGHPLPRRRFPLRTGGLAAPDPRVRPPPGAGGGDEPALRRRAGHVPDRSERRPPLPHAGLGGGRLRAGRRGPAGRGAWSPGALPRAHPCRPGGGRRPGSPPGAIPGAGRHPTAARGARAGPRHERGARQRGHHGPSLATRAGRRGSLLGRAPRAGPRDRGRQARHAGRDRLESGPRGPGRPGPGRAPRPRPQRALPVPARGRDVAPLQLEARPESPLRELGRRTVPGGRGLPGPAAHRAALREHHRHRPARGLPRRGRPRGHAAREGPLGGTQRARPGRPRGPVGSVAPPGRHPGDGRARGGRAGGRGRGGLGDGTAPREGRGHRARPHDRPTASSTAGSPAMPGSRSSRTPSRS